MATERSESTVEVEMSLQIFYEFSFSGLQSLTKAILQKRDTSSFGTMLVYPWPFFLILSLLHHRCNLCQIKNAMHLISYFITS